MTRRSARLLLILALSSCTAPLASGCGSHGDDAATVDLESRLSSDTGVQWIVHRDDAGRPMFLATHDAPPPAPKGLPREQAAIAFLQRYTSDIGGGDLTSELVLLEDRDGPFASGVHSLRFAQRIPGTDTRVFGADTFVHFDPNGAIRFVAVGLVNDLATLSPAPSKTADDALAVATTDIQKQDPQAQITTAFPASLVVYRADSGKGSLAWRLQLQAFVGGALQAPEIFVDGQTGAVLESHDSAAHSSHTAKAKNVYGYELDCEYDTKAHEAMMSRVVYDDAFSAPPLPTTNRLYQQADLTQSTLDIEVFLSRDLNNTNAVTTTPMVAADPTAFDDLHGLQGSGAAVSSFENLSATDLYFRQQLGQIGWDGTGTTPIRLAVHATTIVLKDPSKPAAGYRWKDIDGYLNEVIYLGDGTENDPTKQPNCALRHSGVALDIVAHEYTHGIVAHTAQWGVEGEAGALNEGFADVLGASTEHWYAAGPNNFTIGEDAWVKAQGIRSLRAPRLFAATFPSEVVPRAYSERLTMTNTVSNDNGHVHDNGVIVGHAFYLMTMGGTNEKSGISVDASQKLDWDASSLLWYSTLYVSHSHFGKTFRDFALAQSYFAELLFPLQQDRLRSVVCAWRAVEVLSDDDVKGFNLTCSGAPAPAPAPTTTASATCAGHGDVVLCDDSAPYSATVCKNGGIVGNVTCSDQTLKCKRASDRDPTGTIDSDGALVCE